MKLYEITSELRNEIELYNQVESDDGLAELEKKLTSLQSSFNDKAIAVAKHILNVESESTQIDAEIERLNVQKKQREKQAEWFKGYLKRSMDATNTTEIDGTILKLKIKKNPPSVEITDEALVPESYKRSKVVVTIDKTAIKEASKGGVGVDGTKIVQTTRLEIK